MTIAPSSAIDLKHRVFQDIWPYLKRTLLAQAVMLVGGLVVARMLGPSNYGLWSALQLFPIYGAYASFGLLVALNREVPIYRGRGDEAKIWQMRNASLGATVGVAAILGGGIFSYALWNREHFDHNLLIGIMFMAAIVGLHQISAYFDVLFRSANDFATVGRLRLYRTLVETSLAVLLVLALSFAGRLLAAGGTSMFLIVYAISRNAFPIRPRWDPGEVSRLIRLGFPLMAVSILYGIWTSLDRLMIIQYLDRTAMGYYSVGLMAISFLSAFPRVVWEILYPRFGERFGETGEPAALERLVVVPLAGMATVSALLVGLVVILLPAGLSVLLPGYMEGLDAARVLVCGSFFLALVAGPGNFLHTVTPNQTPLFLIYGGGLSLGAVFNWLGLSLGYGIVGVAFGMTLAYGVAATALLLYVLAHFSGGRQRLRHLLSLYTPFGLVVLFLIVFELLVPTPRAFGPEAALAIAIKMVAYGGLATGILYAARRWWMPTQFRSIGALLKAGQTVPTPVEVKEDNVL